MTPKIEPMMPWIGIPAHGPMLRPAQAAAYLGVSISTYYERIKGGELPAFTKLGNRARASGVPRAWLDAVITVRVLSGQARTDSYQCARKWSAEESPSASKDGGGQLR